MKSNQQVQRFYLVAIIRLTVLITFFIANIFIIIFSDKSTAPLVLGGLLLISVIIALIIIFFYKRVINKKRIILIQIITDIFFVSSVVYVSGGIVTPFYFLYIFPIIGAALFFQKRGVILVSALSFIIFGLLSDFLYLEIIPFFPGSNFGKINFNLFIYNLVIAFLAFLSTAFLSHSFIENIRKNKKEIEDIQASYDSLSNLNNIILKSMPTGYLSCNIDGELIAYNEKSLLMFKGLYKDKNIYSFIDKSEFKELKEILNKNEHYYKEKYLKDKYIGISVSKLKKIYHSSDIFVIFILDISEKKIMEDKLKNKEKFELIGEMATGIAHEIRNPLASISGAVQFLRKKIEYDQSSQELMRIIIAESERLSNSIESFLVFSKRDNLNMERVNLSKIVEEIILLQKMSVQKDIKILSYLLEECYINADQDKIKQLVWNLISNAVKALRNKGEIEVHLFQEENQKILLIKDNGVGMDSDEIEKIFNPFYSTFTSGIGLGMAVVKKIVEEHGFKIKVKSKKGLGTEVRLWIV